MKKKLTCILFLLFCFLISVVRTNAQAALLVLLFGDKVASEKFNFSVVTGMNFSNISNQPDNKSLHGLNFGLGVNMKLSDKFYLKPEFRPLSPKGYKNNSSLATGTPEIDAAFNNVKTTRTLSYIDIPVLMAYQASKNIQLALGPQVSFLGKAREKYYGAN
ncbi:MAG TPA: outer membrane beta-barrel protein, partial [Panacibacter sp.]|nr:outer membrane beta-barrel protein [Panacibacter sp.]